MIQPLHAADRWSVPNDACSDSDAYRQSDARRHQSQAALSVQK
jgi:hypothetical protein